MKKYYVEIENNIIKNPAMVEGRFVDDIKIEEPFREITDNFYLQYKDLLPATFELDDNDNFINIISLPKPKPQIIDEPVDEEKIAMAEAIIDLESRLSKLEGGN